MQNIGHSTLLGSFAGAVNTNVRNNTFIDNTCITYENRSSDVTELLAKLGSVDRSKYYVPPCVDGTREYIFGEVDRWLDNVDEQNVLLEAPGPENRPEHSIQIVGAW
jgi:hypothetical protein